MGKHLALEMRYSVFVWPIWSLVCGMWRKQDVMIVIVLLCILLCLPCFAKYSTWAPSSPTRATFNPISTAALDWRPESCDRSGNHSGATPPSASKPSSACIRLRYSLSSSTAVLANFHQPVQQANSLLCKRWTWKCRVLQGFFVHFA